MEQGSKPITKHTAGGVVIRRTDPPQVLVIHRPKFDDWTHPKGHIDPGETPEIAAVREVLEETGIKASLGQELSEVYFQIKKDRIKHVRYWLMVVPEDAITSGLPNDEVDEARWLEADAAKLLLSYERDEQLIDEALRLL